MSKCFECDAEITRICLACNPLAREWQVIETAPQDLHTDILVIDTRLDVQAVVCWHPLGGRGDEVGGWHPSECLPHTFKPTHWMPLQAPPNDHQNAVRVAKQATGEE